tara:strand:- start:18222 stop:19058 length:837 start_codon:yes stop_codon:yes gene_type:complete
MIFLIFSSEFFIRKFVINSDDVYQRTLLYKKRISKNTIWGDSASLKGINNMKNFINFSGPSDNYQEIEKKIKNYYGNNKGGKVIIHLSLNGLAKYRDRKIRKDRLKLYFEKDPILFVLNNRYQRRVYKYIITYIRNGFNLKNKSTINEDGSISSRNIYVPLSIKKVNKNHKYLPKEDFLDDKNLKALLRTIEYLNKNEIKICFITTPWNKSFRENEIDMNKFIKIRNFYNKLALEKNISYFDFLEYPLSNIYFSDQSHLNLEGSKILTPLVENYCKEV